MENKKLKFKIPIVGLFLLIFLFLNSNIAAAPSYPEYALAYDYNNNGAIDIGDLETKPVQLVITIPTTFSLKEWQSAHVTNHKDIRITINKIITNPPCTGEVCPLSDVREKVEVTIEANPCAESVPPDLCTVPAIIPTPHTIFVGETLEVFGVKLKLLDIYYEGYTKSIPPQPLGKPIARFDISFAGEQKYCPEINQPLCALDGKTYTNACELENAGQQASCDGQCPCSANRVDLSLEYDQTTTTTLNEKQYTIKALATLWEPPDLDKVNLPTPPYLEDPDAPPSVPTVPPSEQQEEFVRPYQWPNQQNTPTGAVVGESSDSIEATTTTIGPEAKVKIDMRPKSIIRITTQSGAEFTTDLLVKYQSQTFNLEERTLRVFIKDISQNAQGKIITRFAIFDLTGEITPPPEDQTCENGCLSGGVCFSYGIRIQKQGQSLYCDFTGEFIQQKQIGQSCQNDFECQTNACSNNICYDIQKELRETRGLLERILAWLRRIF